MVLSGSGRACTTTGYASSEPKIYLFGLRAGKICVQNPFDMLTQSCHFKRTNGIVLKSGIMFSQSFQIHYYMLKIL